MDIVKQFDQVRQTIHNKHLTISANVINNCSSVMNLKQRKSSPLSFKQQRSIVPCLFVRLLCTSTCKGFFNYRQKYLGICVHIQDMFTYVIFKQFLTSKDHAKKLCKWTPYILFKICENIHTYLRYLEKCTSNDARILTPYIPKTYVHFFKDMFLCTTPPFRYVHVYISLDIFLDIFTYLDISRCPDWDDLFRQSGQ